MSEIVDMGITYDGQCCVCRESINPSEPIWMKATPTDGAKHTVAHAMCVEEAKPYIANMVREAIESGLAWKAKKGKYVHQLGCGAGPDEPCTCYTVPYPFPKAALWA